MNAIFWNVDTQRDFMDTDGKLSIAGAQEIVGNLEKITGYARISGIQVVNTADWHNQDTKEISTNPDYKKTFPAHCMEYTSGAEYIQQTQPLSPYVIDWKLLKLDKEGIASHVGDIVIRKDAFDVFAGNPHTEEILQVLNPKRVVVYGVATNVCVDYAVTGLSKRQGLKVYVVSDAIKGLPNLPVEPILEKWQKMGVTLITTEQLISGNYARQK